MHGAGFQGRATIASKLIKYGIRPNDFHSDGYSPIHRAAWGRESRHTETVRVLITEGKVDPNTLSKDGKTAFDMT
jgi:ankyrin repeat protein